ncbi:MerR family transcriptional regulator [Streptomyces sp. CB02923]|uniref:MerR family transcriptional regulator n=1 Tax=Streptomyces sp. CB02923 TaxID=1718985 RepID=UPI000A71C082|nr:MerR family transcriptional regulator [Streptomyces sp. CB02923]
MRGDIGPDTVDGVGGGDGGRLLSIGAFARAARLSPKALRLYGELGLLPPAQVDPANGYRRYTLAQLERARLVAWLRRLGMPLARIRDVCELAPGPAAEAVAAYWARVETDTAARRELAAFLVDHLKGKDATMTKAKAQAKAQAQTKVESETQAQAGVGEARAASGLGIRYAALSDTGLVRASNQDTAYAGDRLLAVADGFGGAGASAGAAAVEALRGLEDFDGGTLRPGDLLNALADAAGQANRSVGEVVAAAAGRGEEAGACAGSDLGSGAGPAGTTLTAMLWTGSHLALVHVGDSRAYLLRGGELFQITHDHTHVQSLVEEGRLTPAEAESHPQRALLIRALDGSADFAPEVGLREARPGDRYLLCSDGLSAVVPSDAVRDVLGVASDPGRAVRDLVALAHDAGAPDNVSCVVADVSAIVEPDVSDVASAVNPDVSATG